MAAAIPAHAAEDAATEKERPDEHCQRPDEHCHRIARAARTDPSERDKLITSAEGFARALVARRPYSKGANYEGISPQDQTAIASVTVDLAIAVRATVGQRYPRAAPQRGSTEE